MFINIYVSSKNSISLNTFLRFFLKISKNKQIKTNIYSIQHSKPKLTKKFSILKSPHVNKKAQDQFEFRVYRKQLSLYSYQGLKLLMILKKIQCKLFADVKIKVEFVLNENKFYKETHKKFNPNKFSLKKNKVNSLSSKSYLQFLDVYGEPYFKNNL